MQICLLKQIKQTVTAKNTDTVGQGYHSYCEKYDCFYEDYLLKQIKETITAKNTDTVGQGYPLKQSNSYFEKPDCCLTGLSVKTIRQLLRKIRMLTAGLSVKQSNSYCEKTDCLRQINC